MWTSEDISKVLIQLDEMELPFSKYAVCHEQGSLKLLGRGGFARVFAAQTRSSKKQNYAMKVIGFEKRTADPAIFNASVKVQKEIGDYVVKIYDHAELWVTLDEKDNVLTAVKEKPETPSRTTIKLQFVLMEKVPSVFRRTKGGNIKMLPEELSHGDEKEILKLAYDIGMALKRAHNNNILHRDVKLENVFYSEKNKQYKLGDFGIAKKTENGFAGYGGSSDGYAAPEVQAAKEEALKEQAAKEQASREQASEEGASKDRLDNTADIYSFGMMLYVLANNIKFPDSKTYNVNFSIQYTPGYIVPEPECDISTDLYNVIAKACMYNPDDRYQSMEELLLDIEKLLYGASLGYKKEHKKASLVVGSIMLALGVALWKLTMAPNIDINFSLWEYIFLMACLGKGVLKAFKKDEVFTSLVVFGVGVYLMIGSGFSWVKLLFLLWMTFSSGTSSGYLSAGALIANFISLLQQGGTYADYYNDYSWVAITLISIASVLLYQYVMLSTEDRNTANQYYQKGLFWVFIVAIYSLMLLSGMVTNYAGERIYRVLLGDWITDFIFSFDRMMVGLYGLAFCIFWIGREKFLIYMQKRQIQRMNEQYERKYYD